MFLFSPLAPKSLPSSSFRCIFTLLSILCELLPVLKGELLTQRGLGFTCVACSALKTGAGENTSMLLDFSVYPGGLVGSKIIYMYIDTHLSRCEIEEHDSH